jgi:hypothetical protein
MKKQEVILFTAEQMAEFLDVKRRQLANLVADGVIPRFGRGRAARFPLSAMRFAELHHWRVADPQHDCIYRWRLEMSYESDFYQEWCDYFGREPTAGEASLAYIDRRWREWMEEPSHEGKRR